MSDRGPLARLGLLAIVGVGVVVCPLFAGRDLAHVHADGARPKAHRHLHAGDHRHPAGGHHDGGQPEPADEEGRDRVDPVVSLSDGAPLLPGVAVVRVDRQGAAATAPLLGHSPRPADIRSHGGSRAPPA